MIKLHSQLPNLKIKMLIKGRWIMAYSTETRIKALSDCVNGYTDEQVSAKHGVSTYTLNNWKKLLLTTKSLDKKKVVRKSGTPYKYTPEKIGALLAKSTTTPVTKEPTKTSNPPQNQDLLLQPKPKKKKKKKS